MVFTDPSLYDFVKYDGENVLNINKLIEVKPSKHTFIFIKEMLRCAKTLECKDYLGVLYDRYSSSVDDTAIIQGLVGRLTGYKDNGVSICYTNIGSIERYEALWNSKFSDKTLPWFSKTTKYKDGVIVPSGTFNDPGNYKGFDNNDDDDITIEEIEPEICRFAAYEEAKQYYIDNLKTILGGRGPNKPIPNDEGFYEGYIRGKRKIYTCNEIYNERRWGITNATFRLQTCYRDVKDKSTLEFWLIHYVKF
jgi:hypothetical protein